MDRTSLHGAHGDRAVGMDAAMLLLIFLGACSPAGMAAAVVSSGAGPCVLGRRRWPSRWERCWRGGRSACPGLGRVAGGDRLRCGRRGGLEGASLIAYLGLSAVLLVVLDRFAALGRPLRVHGAYRWTGAWGHPAHRSGGAEFAHARRQGMQLPVASISVAGSRRVCAYCPIARDVLSDLRRTDVIVRAASDRLLIVLPASDREVAGAVLMRCLDGDHGDLLVGVATFPHDGPTFAALRDAAQARERHWAPHPASRPPRRSVRRPGAPRRPGARVRRPAAAARCSSSSSPSGCGCAGSPTSWPWRSPPRWSSR